MKKSSFIHGASIVAAIWGVLALIGAWLAGENGTIWGFSQEHCFNDAIVLMLISISAGVCALYRRQLEREGR
jgi:membrane protein DedA with SNARE-associated domain